MGGDEESVSFEDCKKELWGEVATIVHTSCFLLPISFLIFTILPVLMYLE